MKDITRAEDILTSLRNTLDKLDAECSKMSMTISSAPYMLVKKQPGITQKLKWQITYHQS